MASTFAPHHSSPLTRAISPFKDPRPPPPCTPRNTAKLWDEYEKRAIENAKRRDITLASSPLQTPYSTRFSSGTVLDIIKSYDPHSSPRLPTSSPAGISNCSFQSTPERSLGGFATSTTVAICKTCKQSITSASGICDRCKKTIIMPSSGETTPPLSPACRNFASTDLPKLREESRPIQTTPTASSPKRRSRRPSLKQINDLPIRLSSLKPPPPTDNNLVPSEPARTRKTSLTDPNEPFLRIQITRKPVPRTFAATSSPTTPPSTSHSHISNPRTRPSSHSYVTTPPQYATSSRHISETPSELGGLYPYLSGSTATPPSVCRASYSLQNTTSAWDDWDNDEEEKTRLIGYWLGKKWRGSRGSFGGPSGRRDSSEGAGGGEEGKRRRRGFVRVISCGCAEE